jgi:hypothetical protein
MLNIWSARGKTKNDHFRERLIHAFADKQLLAKTVLFDSWYSAWKNLKLVHALKKTFFTTLKSNRLVSLSKEQGYSHLEALIGHQNGCNSASSSNWKRSRSRSNYSSRLPQTATLTAHYQWAGWPPDRAGRPTGEPCALAGRRIAPRTETIDWLGEVPMPQSPLATQSPSVLLLRMDHIESQGNRSAKGALSGQSGLVLRLFAGWAAWSRSSGVFH